MLTKTVKIALTSFLVFSVFACTAPTTVKKKTTGDDISADRSIKLPLSLGDIMKAKAEGKTAKDLVSQGATLMNLKRSDYSASDLKDAGFDGALVDALTGGKTLRDLKDSFSQQVLKTAGFDDGLVDDLFAGKQANELTRYPLKTLREAGFTAKELKDVGITAKDLRLNGGYTAKELKDASVTVKELKDLGVLDPELKEAGFTDEQIKQGSF